LISLIICSRTVNIDQRLEANIKSTIGCPFELVVINNSENQYHIFEAYNLGVQKSKGGILCFLHDDILFHTNDWGLKVIEHFADQNIGAIGISGTEYLPKAPGSWWSGGLVNQYISYQERSSLKISTVYTDGEKTKRKEVIALDGAWLCIKKELFKKIKFDSECFKGFHFYDMDICMQIHVAKYKLMATFNILIEHNSAGNINAEWIQSAKLFNQKWKQQLPASCNKISFGKTCTAELRTIREFSKILAGHTHTIKQSYLFAIHQLSANYKLYFYYRTPKYLFYFIKKIITQKS